jgi:hypothetical protein
MSTNILNLFIQKHHPGINIEEYGPIIPKQLIVQEEDISTRIDCELMAGICMSLMGDNIASIVDALNMYFRKNIKILPLVRTDKDHKKLQKEIKGNKNYKDGVFYPKGYFDDSVHWYYENSEGSFDGYSQMKQMDGGHQFCQGHAISLGYYENYRYTCEDIKEKDWFINGDMSGAYEDAYMDTMNNFRTLLPIMFQSIRKKELIGLINQLIKYQYIHKAYGGEDPRYYEMVKGSILNFLKLFIRKPAFVISKKNKNVPVIKQKGTTAKINKDLAGEITEYIINILTQEWAIKYMATGYYIDYDKLDYNPLDDDEFEDEDSDFEDEDSDFEDEDSDFEDEDSDFEDEDNVFEDEDSEFEDI